MNIVIVLITIILVVICAVLYADYQHVKRMKKALEIQRKARGLTMDERTPVTRDDGDVIPETGFTGGNGGLEVRTVLYANTFRFYMVWRLF